MRQPRDLRVELQARLALGLCELELTRLELADVLHADLPTKIGEDVVLGGVDHRRERVDFAFDRIVC